jgi:hypothetical protein
MILAYPVMAAGMQLNVDHSYRLSWDSLYYGTIRALHSYSSGRVVIDFEHQARCFVGVVPATLTTLSLSMSHFASLTSHNPLLPNVDFDNQPLVDVDLGAVQGDTGASYCVRSIGEKGALFVTNGMLDSILLTMKSYHNFIA